MFALLSRGEFSFFKEKEKNFSFLDGETCTFLCEQKSSKRIANVPFDGFLLDFMYTVGFPNGFYTNKFV